MKFTSAVKMQCLFPPVAPHCLSPILATLRHLLPFTGTESPLARGLYPSSPQGCLARPLSFHSARVKNSWPGCIPRSTTTGLPHSVLRPTRTRECGGRFPAVTGQAPGLRERPRSSPAGWGSRSDIHSTEAPPPGEGRCSLRMAPESLQGRTSLTSQGHPPGDINGVSPIRRPL